MTPGAVIAGLAYVLMLGFCGYQLARIRQEAVRESEDLQMALLLSLGDQFWVEEEETDAAFCRTLEEIQALKIANPWDLQAP
jgi:hypothetical protein